MKKLALIASLIAAMPFAASAQTVNTIKFTGSIVETGCSVKSSTMSGGTADKPAASSNIFVDMGAVAVANIGTLDASLSGKVPQSAGASTNVVLTFDCGSTSTINGKKPTSFTVLFSPEQNQIDNPATGTLKVTGGAEGVAIALLQNDERINIKSGNPIVTGTIDGTTGTMSLRAMYVTNGKGIKPGTANADLPFTLRYN